MAYEARVSRRRKPQTFDFLCFFSFLCDSSLAGVAGLSFLDFFGGGADTSSSSSELESEPEDSSSSSDDASSSEDSDAATGAGGATTCVSYRKMRNTLFEERDATYCDRGFTWGMFQGLHASLVGSPIYEPFLLCYLLTCLISL